MDSAAPLDAAGDIESCVARASCASSWLLIMLLWVCSLALRERAYMQKRVEPLQSNNLGQEVPPDQPLPDIIAGPAGVSVKTTPRLTDLQK